MAAGTFTVRLSTGATMSAAYTQTAGSVITVNGTIASSALQSQLNAAPTGPVTIKPLSGATFNVTGGGLGVSRPDVTILGASFVAPHGVGFYAGGDRGHWNGGTSGDMAISGNTGVVIENVAFDSKSLNANCAIYATNWTLRNCSFTGFGLAASPADHSEALYIGRGSGGLITGCTFRDTPGAIGVNTAHVFLTWWPGLNNDGVYHAGDMVRNLRIDGCTFYCPNRAFFHINCRQEIQPSDGDLATNNRFQLPTGACTTSFVLGTGNTTF